MKKILKFLCLVVISSMAASCNPVVNDAETQTEGAAGGTTAAPRIRKRRHKTEQTQKQLTAMKKISHLHGG